MSTYDKKWSSFIKEENFDSNKFIIQKTLNKKIWQNTKIQKEINKKLLEIARDFYEHLDSEVSDLPELEDVIFTGSLASYNYHDLSDIDLHLILDFSKFKKDPNLLEKYFTAKRINWNKVHDIMINGYEVEIYIQDANEEHMASGIYSIMKGEWIKKPIRKEVSIDFESAKKKYASLSAEISELQKMISKEEYRKVYDHTIKLKQKIKKMRRAGLKKDGVYSSENLAFKMLRINLELEKLNNLKLTSYDKMMSADTYKKTRIDISENWWNSLVKKEKRNEYK